ncbi:hypothetical protein BC829DRAFT_422153 [Chytridium lagenaria]|nr:hypothetical protein BC829DRAFT_422153 [Chytridium lagenaria]
MKELFKSYIKKLLNFANYTNVQEEELRKKVLKCRCCFLCIKWGFALGLYEKLLEDLQSFISIAREDESFKSSGSTLVAMKGEVLMTMTSVGGEVPLLGGMVGENEQENIACSKLYICIYEKLISVEGWKKICQEYLKLMDNQQGLARYPSQASTGCKSSTFSFLWFVLAANNNFMNATSEDTSSTAKPSSKKEKTSIAPVIPCVSDLGVMTSPHMLNLTQVITIEGKLQDGVMIIRLATPLMQVFKVQLKIGSRPTGYNNRTQPFG